MGMYVYGATKKTVQTTTGETVRLFKYLYKHSFHMSFSECQKFERYSNTVEVYASDLVVFANNKAELDKYATMDGDLAVYKNEGGTINYGYDDSDPVGYLVKRGDRYELVEVATMRNYQEEKRWA